MNRPDGIPMCCTCMCEHGRTGVCIIIKANPFGRSQNAAANGPLRIHVCPLQFIIVIRSPSATADPDHDGKNLRETRRTRDILLRVLDV